ncbi:MAG: nucleotidyltransferase domain-containing protein [Candidatus Korarchaeum sp.]
MPGWSKYAGRRIDHLKRWKQYVKLLYEVARGLSSEVYVIGGAAEDRLTVLSDIDLVIVVEEALPDSDRRRIKADILWAAVERGLPLDYPVEIHILSREEFETYLRHGTAIRVV